MAIPPGGWAGFSQMTPATRIALSKGGARRASGGKRRRRKTKATKRRKTRKAKGSRKMKFGSPAWQKKYKVGKYRRK